MKFYSETLDTMFDAIDDLQEAEKRAAEKEAAKKKASDAKKAEAKVVEDAFKSFNAAKRTYNETVLELKKKFNADLTALKKAHELDMQKASKIKEDAELAYQTALNEFIKKHPEGYHMTLKDGDHVVTLSSNVGKETEAINQLLDPKSFWADWIKLFI